MKRFSRLFAKVGSLMAALAMVVGVSSMNSASILWFKQPHAPEEMNEYIR